MLCVSGMAGQLTFLCSDWGAGWCTGWLRLLWLLLISRYVLLHVWMNIKTKMTHENISTRAWRATCFHKQYRNTWKRIGHRVNSKNLRSDKPKKVIISLIGEINEAQEGERTRQQQKKKGDIILFMSTYGKLWLEDWASWTKLATIQSVPSKEWPSISTGVFLNFPHPLSSAPHPITLQRGIPICHNSDAFGRDIRERGWGGG